MILPNIHYWWIIFPATPWCTVKVFLKPKNKTNACMQCINNLFCYLYPTPVRVPFKPSSRCLPLINRSKLIFASLLFSFFLLCTKEVNVPLALIRSFFVHVYFFCLCDIRSGSTLCQRSCMMFTLNSNPAFESRAPLIMAWIILIIRRKKQNVC